MLIPKKITMALMVVSLAAIVAGTFGLSPAAATEFKVLLAPAVPESATYNDLKTQLENDGLYVEIFDASQGTPDLSYLANFDAVITWANAVPGYKDKNAMGDVLADFVDPTIFQGTNKGVILTEFNKEILGGRINNNWLSPFNTNGAPWVPEECVGDVAPHPLLDGVDTVNLCASNRPNVIERGPRVETIAWWKPETDQPPFVALNQKGSVIGIAGPSPADHGTYKGDYLKLFANAAYYVAKRPKITTLTATPTGGMAPLDVTFTAEATSAWDPGPIQYRWDFEDDGIIYDDNVTPSTPTHTYIFSGYYSASVSAVDSVGRSTTSRITIGAETLFDSYQLPAALKLDPDTALRAFRMISIPVVPAGADKDLFTMIKGNFGGVPDSGVWRMFKSAPPSNPPEITKAGDDKAGFGKGWWIISASPKRPKGDPLVVQGVPTFADVNIEVGNGYQMVGCPYTDMSPDWGDIVADPDNEILKLGGTIYSWDGSGDYTNPTLMEPGKAYWAYVARLAGGTLKIPAPLPGYAARTPLRLAALDKARQIVQPPPPLPPSAMIKLLAPNGGKTLKGGSSYDIRWEASGISPKGLKSTVTISYSMNGGKKYVPIVKGAKNNGKFAWRVPKKRSSKCLVKIVSDLYPSMHDRSNSVFQISFTR